MKLLGFLTALLIFVLPVSAADKEPPPGWKRGEAVKTITIPKLEPSPAPKAMILADLDSTAIRKRIREIERVSRPELQSVISYSKGTAESIHRTETRFSWTRGERLALSLSLNEARYRYHGLEEGLLQSKLQMLNLEARYRYGKRLSVASSLNPYRQGRLERIGGGLTAESRLNDWVTAMFRVSSCMPWSESTQSLRENGTVHAASAALSMTFPRHLTLTLDGEKGWYYLGADNLSGDKYAGDSITGGARLEFRMPEKGSSLGEGFLDPSGRYEDSFYRSFLAYATVRRRLRNPSKGSETVPVTEESTEVKLGLNLSFPAGRRLGISADGFLGQDSAKNISFPDLYGATVRCSIVTSERIRIWSGYEMISESSSGTVGGKTEVIRCGFNFNF